MAKKSFHHDAIGTLAKLIYTSRLALAAAMPGEIKIQAPSTDKDANIVVHPGALAYLTDDQKSFFDKYGDDIFYGLLIFPIFGSAIAAVAGYLRRNSRTKRLRLLQRLLDLTQKANHAPSLEALHSCRSTSIISWRRSFIRPSRKNTTRACNPRSRWRSIRCAWPSPAAVRSCSSKTARKQSLARRRPPLGAQRKREHDDAWDSSLRGATKALVIASAGATAWSCSLRPRPSAHTLRRGFWSARSAR